MHCNRCKKNNMSIDDLGFFCKDCREIMHKAYMNRTFQEICFQCHQRGDVIEAVWKAYAWAVTFGQPQTTYHCETHKPAYEPKIISYNKGHGFKIFKIENNKRIVVIK